MFKNVSGKLAWGVAALCLLCVGFGAALFTRITGVFLMFIGFAAGYMWYRKYGKKVAPKAPTSPAASSTTPKTDPPRES